MDTAATRGCDDLRSVEGSVRCVQSDGSAIELSWESSGRFSLVEVGPDGTREDAAAFDPSGELRFTGLPAAATETWTNAYGTSVEREEHPYFVVERSYDDNARPFRTTVAGDWGELVVELRTDGSRSVRWSVAAIDVEQVTDAGGAAGEVRVRRARGTHER